MQGGRNKPSVELLLSIAFSTLTLWYDDRIQ